MFIGIAIYSAQFLNELRVLMRHVLMVQQTYFPQQTLVVDCMQLWRADACQIHNG